MGLWSLYGVRYGGVVMEARYGAAASSVAFDFFAPPPQEASIPPIRQQAKE